MSFTFMWSFPITELEHFRLKRFDLFLGHLVPMKFTFNISVAKDDYSESKIVLAMVI